MATNTVFDKAVADMLEKLAEVLPQEDEWTLLPYGDGAGRRYMSIQSRTQKIVILVNEWGEFKVITPVAGGDVHWFEVTKLLCGAAPQMYVMEDKWYLAAETVRIEHHGNDEPSN